MSRLEEDKMSYHEFRDKIRKDSNTVSHDFYDIGNQKVGPTTSSSIEEDLFGTFQWAGSSSSSNNNNKRKNKSKKSGKGKLMNGSKNVVTARRNSSNSNNNNSSSNKNNNKKKINLRNTLFDDRSSSTSSCPTSFSDKLTTPAVTPSRSSFNSSRKSMDSHRRREMLRMFSFNHQSGRRLKSHRRRSMDSLMSGNGVGVGGGGLDGQYGGSSTGRLGRELPRNLDETLTKIPTTVLTPSHDAFFFQSAHPQPPNPPSSSGGAGGGGGGGVNVPLRRRSFHGESCETLLREDGIPRFVFCHEESAIDVDDEDDDIINDGDFGESDNESFAKLRRRLQLGEKSMSVPLGLSAVSVSSTIPTKTLGNFDDDDNGGKGTVAAEPSSNSSPRRRRSSDLNRQESFLTMGSSIPSVSSTPAAGAAIPAAGATTTTSTTTTPAVASSTSQVTSPAVSVTTTTISEVTGAEQLALVQSSNHAASEDMSNNTCLNIAQNRKRRGTYRRFSATIAEEEEEEEEEEEDNEDEEEELFRRKESSSDNSGDIGKLTATTATGSSSSRPEAVGVTTNSSSDQNGFVDAIGTTVVVSNKKKKHNAGGNKVIGSSSPVITADGLVPLLPFQDELCKDLIGTTSKGPSLPLPPGGGAGAGVIRRTSLSTAFLDDVQEHQSEDKSDPSSDDNNKVTETGSYNQMTHASEGTEQAEGGGNSICNSSMGASNGNASSNSKPTSFEQRGLGRKWGRRGRNFKKATSLPANSTTVTPVVEGVEHSSTPSATAMSAAADIKDKKRIKDNSTTTSITEASQGDKTTDQQQVPAPQAKKPTKRTNRRRRFSFHGIIRSGSSHVCGLSPSQSNSPQDQILPPSTPHRRQPRRHSSGSGVVASTNNNNINNSSSRRKRSVLKNIFQSSNRNLLLSSTTDTNLPTNNTTTTTNPTSVMDVSNCITTTITTTTTDTNTTNNELMLRRRFIPHRRGSTNGRNANLETSHHTVIGLGNEHQILLERICAEQMGGAGGAGAGAGAGMEKSSRDKAATAAATTNLRFSLVR